MTVPSSQHCESDFGGVPDSGDSLVDECLGFVAARA